MNDALSLAIVLLHKHATYSVQSAIIDCQMK